MLSKIKNYLKSIRFYPGPERRWLAVLSAVLCLVSFLAAIDLLFTFMTYVVITEDPQYKYALVTSLVPRNMPIFAEFALLHPAMMSFFAMFLAANASVISFGVQRGKAWGRVSASYFLYLLAFMALILLIFPGIAIPEKVVNGGEEFEAFNSFVSLASAVLRVICAAITLGSLYAARFFEKLSEFPKSNFYLPKEEKKEENEKTDEISKNEKKESDSQNQKS